MIIGGKLDVLLYIIDNQYINRICNLVKCLFDFDTEYYMKIYC